MTPLTSERGHMGFAAKPQLLGMLLALLALSPLPSHAQEIGDPTAQECALDNLAGRLATIEDVCCTEPTQCVEGLGAMIAAAPHPSSLLLEFLAVLSTGQPHETGRNAVDSTDSLARTM